MFIEFAKTNKLQFRIDDDSYRFPDFFEDVVVLMRAKKESEILLGGMSRFVNDVGETKSVSKLVALLPAKIISATKVRQEIIEFVEMFVSHLGVESERIREDVITYVFGGDGYIVQPRLNLRGVAQRVRQDIQFGSLVVDVLEKDLGLQIYGPDLILPQTSLEYLTCHEKNKQMMRLFSQHPDGLHKGLEIYGDGNFSYFLSRDAKQPDTSWDLSLAEFYQNLE